MRSKKLQKILNKKKELTRISIISKWGKIGAFTKFLSMKI